VRGISFVMVRPQETRRLGFYRSEAEVLLARITSALAVAGFVFLGGAVDARGTAAITKSSGVVKTYDGVRIHMLGDSGLRITSPDGHGSLTIAHAACSFAGELRRCLPYRLMLDQHGVKHLIDVERGTLYLNTTGEPLQLPHSSTQIPPHSIVLAVETQRGTLISVTGQIDGTPQ
jgi:hypothetical protein